MFREYYQMSCQVIVVVAVLTLIISRLGRDGIGIGFMQEVDRGQMIHNLSGGRGEKSSSVVQRSRRKASSLFGHMQVGSIARLCAGDLY
jgi:hypothetical protein